MPTIAQPTPPPQATVAVTAILNVQVPTQATVYVNGNRTESTGRSRRYVLKMAPGRVADVEVRAVITQSGRQVEKVQTARLRARGEASLSFGFENPETIVTVNVPPDAIVHLVGKKMSSSGSVRQFRTTLLAEGQQWRDYKIRATVERNGRLLSKEQTLLLKSGDSKVITFDFEDAAVTARRSDGLR